MLEADETSLRREVTAELTGLLASNGFASRLARHVGAALHERLVEWPDESETEFSRHAPVNALYLWLAGGWGLDPAWVAESDGTWLDDRGNPLPANVTPSMTATEQLAVYGLWLLKTEFFSLGPVPAGKSGEQGWTREEVLSHRAACIALAYQALVYAQKFLLGNKLSAEDIAKVARAATARQAAEALHSKPGGTREKRAAIRSIWSSGKYSSRDICAEQECASLGMSFSTARKALIGTPDPSSRRE